MNYLLLALIVVVVVFHCASVSILQNQINSLAENQRTMTETDKHHTEGIKILTRGINNLSDALNSQNRIIRLLATKSGESQQGR